MARRHEFRMDRASSSGLGRLLLTRQQRLSLERWSLYGLLCLVALLIQDVVLYRVNILGAGTDLVPCVIFVIVLQQTVENGSLFAFVCSLLYYGSGSAPGPHVVFLITVISVLLSIFRQSYLQQGFPAVLLSTALGMLGYEMCVFLAGVITGQTMLSRMGVLLLTAVWSLLCLPVCYPVVRAIGKIGGDLWRE